MKYNIAAGLTFIAFFIFFFFFFLDAASHLYKRPCPSVGPSVCNGFVIIDEKWTFTDSKSCLEILNKMKRIVKKCKKNES